jgi:hypothetical protein
VLPAWFSGFVPELPSGALGMVGADGSVGAAGGAIAGTVITVTGCCAAVFGD